MVCHRAGKEWRSVGKLPCGAAERELGRSCSRSREGRVPKRNTSWRHSLFRFLIENEFNIYSIQTNMNLERAWSTDC